MTDSKELIQRLRAKIEAIPPRDRSWYVVRDPWRARDDEPWIISGNIDPHLGMMVCSFDDAAISGVDDKFSDDEWSDHNWAMAEYIEAADPNAVLSLLKEISELREALKPFVEEFRMERDENPQIDLVEDGSITLGIRINDLRTARAKLEGSKS